MNQNHPYYALTINKIAIVAISFIALWLGAMVYIQLRCTNTLFIQWIKAAGFDDIFLLDHNSFIHLPNWLIYTLPSGLWALSYSIVITGIWWNSQSWIKYVWLASIFLLAAGWEILQLTNLFSGTYSIGDIIAGLIGAVTGIYLGILMIKPKYYEKEFK